MKRIYILLIGVLVASTLMIGKPVKGEAIWSSMEKTGLSTLSGDVLVINFNSVEYSLPMVKGFHMIYDSPVLGVMVSSKFEIGEGGNSPPILQLHTLRTKKLKERTKEAGNAISGFRKPRIGLNSSYFV